MSRYSPASDFDTYQGLQLQIESLEREMLGALEPDERDRLSDEIYQCRRDMQNLSSGPLGEYLE
jgi:hypothetical protein